MQPHPEASPQTISIRRHCMQNLLHELLVNEPRHCSGLLAKAGNIIETQLHVTQKLLASGPDTVTFIRQQQLNMAAEQLQICGIYHTSGAGRSAIARLAEHYESALGVAPECYLLLDPDQAGRIDAALYQDSELQRHIALDMVEEAA